MSTSVLYMSMSLDGYIAGLNDEPGIPGGHGFDRLHEWITTPDGEYGRPSGPAGELYDEWNATGAVLAGRRTAEQVGHWGGDHHDGVPIFVLSHRPPGPSVASYPLCWTKCRSTRSRCCSVVAAVCSRCAASPAGRHPGCRAGGTCEKRSD